MSIEVKEGGFIMDKVDEICDTIDDFIQEKGYEEMYGEMSEEDIEALAYRILDELNICEKCGAKLRGERNE